MAASNLWKEELQEAAGFRRRSRNFPEEKVYANLREVDGFAKPAENELFFAKPAENDLLAGCLKNLTAFGSPE